MSITAAQRAAFRASLARHEAIIQGWVDAGIVVTKTFSRGPVYYSYECAVCGRGICSHNVCHTQGAPMCMGCAGHISGGVPMSERDWRKWLGDAGVASPMETA